MLGVGRGLTRADQFRDVPVARDFAVGDLLHRAVDGVEECCCFVRAGHILWCSPTQNLSMAYLRA